MHDRHRSVYCTVVGNIGDQRRGCRVLSPPPPFIRRCHPCARKSTSQAVLGKMQLTLHATRQTPHGALRLVHAMSAWSVKTRRALSRHCRDVRVYGYMTTAMDDMCDIDGLAATLTKLRGRFLGGSNFARNVRNSFFLYCILCGTYEFEAGPK